MSNKFTAQQFLDQTFERLQTVAMDNGQKWMGEAKSFIDSQKATLDSFQKEVDKRFNTIVEPVKEINKTASDLNKLFQLDSTKAFMRDPVKGGESIVIQGLKKLDKWIAKYIISPFKVDLLEVLEKIVRKILEGIGRIVTTIVKGIWNVTIKPFLALIKAGVDASKKGIDKVPNAVFQQIIRNGGQIFGKLIGPLSTWSRNIGLTGVVKEFPKLLQAARTTSQSAAAFRDLGKILPQVGRGLALTIKILPILAELFNAYWKQSVTDSLADLERAKEVSARIDAKYHEAVMNRLARIEANTNRSTIDYNKIGSAVRSNIPADLARTRDVSSLSQSIGGLTRAVAGLRIPAATVVDYSRIQNDMTTAVNSAKPAAQTPTVVDYDRILKGVAAVVVAAKPAALTPTVIDYARIQNGVTTAVTAAAPTIASAVTKQQVTPAQLAEKLAQSSNAQQQAQAAQLKQLFGDFKVQLPPDIARKADVDAIPSKIPKPAPVNLSPLQQQLSQLQNSLAQVPGQVAQIPGQIAQIPGQIGNQLNTIGNAITNNITNAITNNNTTIFNQVASALNPATIIDPLKTHINTQVAQPLSKTMEVLNVNDLARGISMNAENVIKASGMQQFGSAGAATATNLVSLTAMIAAPLFMRAGFHQLGTAFPADIRNKDGAKVTPTTALSTSQWQFNQVTNLVGMNTPHLVKDASGATSLKTFQNQAHIVEEIHAQNLGLEQDVSAIEKYCFFMLQNQEMMIQMIMQNKYDIDVLVDESGAKTKQKIIQRPGVVTHTKGASFFDNLMKFAQNHMVVREWQGDIDAKQLALKTNMEAQVAALSNKFEFDKTNPKLPIVDRQKQNPKAQHDDEWQRYVHTSENPGNVRQSPGMPVPEIKEIRFGSDREVGKPTKDPEKLLGS